MRMIDVSAAAPVSHGSRHRRDDHRADPWYPMFRTNTAAFVHDLGADVLANVEGDRNYVRVQVLKAPGCFVAARHAPGIRQVQSRCGYRDAPRFVQV